MVPFINIVAVVVLTYGLAVHPKEEEGWLKNGSLILLGMNISVVMHWLFP